jgi:hypothetical protein
MMKKKLTPEEVSERAAKRALERLRKLGKVEDSPAFKAFEKKLNQIK